MLKYLAISIYISISGFLISKYNHNDLKYKIYPSWNKNFPFQEIEIDLLNLKNIQHIKCIWKCTVSLQKVLLIELCNGLKGIFKSRGYRKMLAEVFAYKISAYLNLNLVPPTVKANINEQKGSLQFFIESKLTLMEQKNKFNYLPKKYISDLKIFNFIFGKFDYFEGFNIVIDIDEDNKLHLASIDHGDSIFYNQISKYGDYTWVAMARSNKKKYSILTWNVTKSCFLKDIPQTIANDFKIESLVKKWSDFKYLIFKNQLYIYFKSFMKSYTNIYFRSTLNSYLKLNLNLLKKLWFSDDDDFDFYCKNKTYFDGIFNDMIIRRDEVLNHAITKGTIMEDV